MKWTDRVGRRVKLRDLHIALVVAEAVRPTFVLGRQAQAHTLTTTMGLAREGGRGQLGDPPRPWVRDGAANSCMLSHRQLS